MDNCDFYKEKLRPETSSGSDFNINVIFGVIFKVFTKCSHPDDAFVDALIVPLGLSSLSFSIPTVVSSMVLWSIISSHNAVTPARFK